MKVIDITEKLDFEANPIIKIKSVEIEINTDATTMLKIMGLFSNKTEVEASLEAADLLFGKEGMKKMQKLNLQIKDFMKVVESAMDIAMGYEEPAGEGETHTTT